MHPVTSVFMMPALFRCLNDRELYEADIQSIVDLSGNLNDRMKVNAEYWAGPPGSAFPPGQWSIIAVWIIQGMNLSMRDQVGGWCACISLSLSGG